MKQLLPISQLLLLGSVISLGFVNVAWATAIATPPYPALPASLAIAQIKITGDEYIVIQNNGSADIADLSQYSLKSFNNTNPAAGGVTTNTQLLPAVSFSSGERMLLSATIRPTCGATLAGKLSLSLTDTGGFLQLQKTSTTSSTSVVQDSVSWSSTANGEIQNVPSSTKAPQALYYRYASDSGFAWQPAEQAVTANCQLSVLVQTASGTTAVEVENIVQDGGIDSAPAIITTATSGEGTVTDVTLSNIGLLAPEITELLPNPSGSGNDATDEYIELYNPNDTSFDLTGYTLRTGTTSLHDFTFSSGAELAAKSFEIYYSRDTGLTLSNTGGRAQLLSPGGTIIFSSEVYGTARDGQTWALAHGNWYWSLTPTPSAANIVTVPVIAPKTTSAKTAATKTTSKTVTAKAAKAPKAAKTPKAPKAKKVKTTKQTISTTPTAAAVTARPVQTRIVAMVAGLAVLYGAYEYRADLANGIFKLRRKLTFSARNRL